MAESKRVEQLKRALKRGAPNNNTNKINQSGKRQKTYNAFGTISQFSAKGQKGKLFQSNVKIYNNKDSQQYSLEDYFKVTVGSTEFKSRKQIRSYPNKKVTICFNNDQTKEFFKLMAQDARHDGLVGNYTKFSDIIEKIADYEASNKTEKDAVKKLINDIGLSGNEDIKSPENKAIEKHLLKKNNNNELTNKKNNKIGEISYSSKLYRHSGDLEPKNKIPYLFDQAQGFIKTVLNPNMFNEASSLSSLGDAGNTLRDITKAGLHQKNINLMDPIKFNITGQYPNGVKFIIFEGTVNFYDNYTYQKKNSSPLKKGAVGVFISNSCFPFFNKTFTPILSRGDSKQTGNLIGKFFGDFSQILTCLSYDIAFVSGDKMAIAMYMFLTNKKHNLCSGIRNHSSMYRKLFAEIGQKSGGSVTTPQKVLFYFESDGSDLQNKQTAILQKFVKPEGKRSSTIKNNNLNKAQNEFVTTINRVYTNPSLNDVVRFAKRTYFNKINIK